MSSNLLFAKDVQGQNSYAPNVSDLKYRAALAQNTETNLTIPNTFPHYIVAFAYSTGANVWVDMSGATVTVPVNPTLQTTTAEFKPGQRTVPGGTKISMITSDTTSPQVEVAIYAKPD